ncbi:hypothetical protein M5E06_10465 [Azospirillum sp. A1-3]|uniref:hypothetical protein n=1 Tax=Azospirillum sp. A1-3 TaxID=185874 RepID=UPI00207769DA|nr:hypothetical protein [Azospirillum sp. A1-3]MCM8734617.1 hypothetical protein [Azospirillum sp. A1-3]
MLSKLADAERILEIAKRLRDEHRKYAKIQERGASLSYANSTPKQREKFTNDLNYQAHHIVKIETELHAAAVDAGLAEIRDASEYKTRTWKPTGWHEYEWTPARPRSLSPAA